MNVKETDKVTGKIVQLLITNISQTTACKYINMCRLFLQKEKHQVLIVSEFKKYMGI